MTYKTYKRTETVKARKVTDKDGENIVTSDGVKRASKGDMVLLSDNGNEVLTADEFANLGWKTPKVKPAAKAAQPKAEPKPATQTAADRVRARAAAAKTRR